jgi:hypothetical protein
LKPLQATSNTDFIFLCKKTIVPRTNEIHELYFDGHSKEVVDRTTHTLASMACKAKSQINIHNTFKWLHANMFTSYNKARWLVRNVSQYEEKLL